MDEEDAGAGGTRHSAHVLGLGLLDETVRVMDVSTDQKP
jgi:hypothetical protein